ncbi:hypothetical protein DW886_03685 [Enterocloster aldenensis]|uniref:HEPN domain-containing protein n=1 Tax=Enterocloster aldenensis TaxID=358742 RepID=UPI000E4DAE9B|nr:hypothetical protein DW886_03685 [Enterocloster aldenensis]
MKEDILINLLNSKLIFVSKNYDQYYPVCRLITSFGDGTVAYIRNEDTTEWDNSIKILYASLCKVETDVSLMEFRSYINRLIYLKKFIDFKSILEHFKNTPLKEYHFIKPALGLKLNNINYVNYSDITIIKKEFLTEYFKDNNNILELIEMRLKMNESLIFIDVACKAKDSTKANELAIKKFKIIDICFRFLLKGSNSKSLRFGLYSLNHESLSNMIGYSTNEFIAIKEENNEHSVSIDDYLETLFETSLAKRVWTLLENSDLNDMEKRIREAIIWISMASHENENSVAFLQCFLALEAILLVQDGFINKSIVAQISEYMAFLLSADSNKRIAIEKEIKKLYSIRSAIAHGKKKSDIDSDIIKIFSLTRTLIVKFLCDESLQQIHKISELCDYITKLKFS